MENEKKPWYKKWYIILIIVIVALAAIGSQANKNNSSSSNNSTSSSSSSSSSNKESDVKESYKVGEEITFDKHTLKVNDIKKSAGSEYDKAKEGQEFVIVNVTITNNGDEKISYNPFDFKMQNSQGNITNHTFTTVNNDTSLNSGELAPGGKVSGTIAFEEPKDDKELVLIFKANVFSDKELKIKLN